MQQSTLLANCRKPRSQEAGLRGTKEASDGGPDVRPGATALTSLGPLRQATRAHHQCLHRKTARGIAPRHR
jgi:hypothetical protein